MQSIHGQEYHWKRDLFLRCNLPITPAMERQWKEEAENHWKQREYRRKEETKNKRIQRKRSRGAEQEKRKEVSVHQEFNSTEILERSLELFETEGKDGEEAEVEERRTRGRRRSRARRRRSRRRRRINQIAGRAMDLQTFQPILEPFATYVFTTISIPAEVEKLTNIKSYRKPGSVLKDAAKPSTAFINFLNWIKKCKEDEKADEVILCGHNISKYDLRLLIDEGFRQGQ